MKRWCKADCVMYSLPVAHDKAEVSSLLRAMLDSHATTSVGGHHAPLPGEVDLLTVLAGHGYVEQVEAGWALTADGLARMTYFSPLPNPRPLSEPRAHALDDLTVFELMLKMHSAGGSLATLATKEY